MTRQYAMLGCLLIGLSGCVPTPTDPPPKPAVETPVEAPEAPPVIPEQREPIMEPAPAEAGSETSATGAATEPAAPALVIEPLSWEQTTALVAAHPGKVVVMDLWATYCSPCIEELPGLVALQAKYPDQVVCISVALDFDGDKDYPVEAAEKDVRKVLEKVSATTIRNVVLTTPSSDVYEKYKLDSIPAVYVFDGTGKKVAEFPDRAVSADVSYEKSVTPFVAGLLPP